MTPPADTVERAIVSLARTRRLLVASDFDGTLAPIAPRPADVVADRAAVAALTELAALEDTHVAILSGRPGEDLRAHVPDLEPRVRLLGSHGTETDRAPAPHELGLRDRLIRLLGDVAESYPGALVERKPLGVAFHVRGVAASRQVEAVEAAERALGHSAGVRLLHGRKVMEAVLREGDKGTALDGLRRSVAATATVFLGDDVTDEDAFRVLGASDVGIKIGADPSAASLRLDDQTDVAPFLRRLLAERAAAQS